VSSGGVCEPCESRCRPEGSGASRWEKTGTVALGSENNETEASRQPIGIFYGSGRNPSAFGYNQQFQGLGIRLPKSLTIPKGTELTDHQTDAELVR